MFGGAINRHVGDNAAAKIGADVDDGACAFVYQIAHKRFGEINHAMKIDVDLLVNLIQCGVQKRLIPTHTCVVDEDIDLANLLASGIGELHHLRPIANISGFGEAGCALRAHLRGHMVKRVAVAAQQRQASATRGQFQCKRTPQAAACTANNDIFMVKIHVAHNNSFAGKTQLKILALETATEACSVALNLDGNIVEHYTVEPRAHARLILQMIDTLLRDHGVLLHELDAIAFGQGPGSFTGVRIAVSVAQGLGFASDKPLIPISTLAALAYPGVAIGGQIIAAAIDARMGEVYWGVFRSSAGELVGIHPECVCRPEQVKSDETIDHAFGTGWATYSEILRGTVKGGATSLVDGQALPRASAVAALAAFRAPGEWVDAAQALPRYLRDQVAEKSVSGRS
jgi:tRNA threonylcarbamoyladenosine biosynthesis protein TsaB